MRFLKAAHTDIGISKSTNQDSVLIREAETEKGNVLFAVVCDGMGGLAKGEVASATVIKHVSDWFETEFPDILYTGLDKDELRISLENFIYRMNSKIQEYGRTNYCNLGTTFVCLILFEGRYFIMNVGDSRAYSLNGGFIPLTKDQSYVQREIDLGRLTPEQAEYDPKRSVLLQCIGVNNFVDPDFYEGTFKEGDAFLLCSDGFRHVITQSEFYQYLNSDAITDENVMKQYLEYFTELNKYRNEKDNISAAVVKAY